MTSLASHASSHHDILRDIATHASDLVVDALLCAAGGPAADALNASTPQGCARCATDRGSTPWSAAGRYSSRPQRSPPRTSSAPHTHTHTQAKSDPRRVGGCRCRPRGCIRCCCRHCDDSAVIPVQSPVAPRAALSCPRGPRRASQLQRCCGCKLLRPCARCAWPGSLLLLPPPAAGRRSGRRFACHFPAGWRGPACRWWNPH